LDSYAESIVENLKNYHKSGRQIVENALKWTVKFSDEEFMRNFFNDLDTYITKNIQI
jgi:hypothetical protein